MTDNIIALDEVSSLSHVSPERWVFDESVTEVFEDMLRRSIPQYDVMRQLVFDIGQKFVQPHTYIVDLGCSRGDALAPFVKQYGDSNRYIGVEISEPMWTAACRRFKNEIATDLVDIRRADLRHEYPDAVASLTLCVLTMMFTPMEYRQRILLNAFTRTCVGGAFILVEKVLGATADLDAIMVEQYHAHKAKQGYSSEQITRKRMSLEGVLSPVTGTWNEELLGSAGFRQVECFWRWLNFGAWVAVKTT